MEEKTVLSKIIRSFQVQSLDPIEEVNPVVEIVSRPKDGIRVKLKQRIDTGREMLVL